MKIGILTQPMHHNYGGIIQNWALQQVLRRMGHRPEMIFFRYNLSAPSLRTRLGRCLDFGKCLVRRCLRGDKSVHLVNPFQRYYNPYERLPYIDVPFVDSAISKTERLFSEKALRKAVGRGGYDAFIVGSDQVWHQEYSPRIKSFFLDFLPEYDRRRRIAYAASFGVGKGYIDEEKMPVCRRLLQRFDAVSVRENEGVEIVRHHFNRQQVEKVLDPTLLLGAADYEAVVEPSDRHADPHIATYILDPDDEKTAIVDEVAGSRQLPVNALELSADFAAMPPISQWIATIATARFVVTDSFHGCVFSIIFGKPFIAIANPERGLDRFRSLLEPLGLEDRLVYDFKDFALRKDQLLTPPDFVEVHRRLDDLRAHSLKFLTDALA